MNATYDPAATANLRRQWHATVSRAVGDRLPQAQAAANFANRSGYDAGTRGWYSAAMWRINQF